MDIYLILLRIAHISAGVFWVGSAIINSAFLLPAAKASGLEGQRFIQSLMVQKRFPIAINLAAWLTILAGILLYWRDSGGLQLSWVTSPVGLGFTVGALAALASFLLGAFFLGPTARRFGALNATIQAESSPPTAELQAEMAKLEARMGAGGRINMVLLAIALLSMATARYWWF